MNSRSYSGRNVDRAFSIDELRHMAKRRVPAFAFEYLEGGADDEVSLTRNREIFSEYQFSPTALVKVGATDASTEIFGQRNRLPIMVAPMGFCGLFSFAGDLSMAKAAAKAGIPFIQSTVSNTTIEEIAGVPGLRHWLQLYVFRSREFMERFVARALAANCEALVITVDGTVFGNREWDKRNYRRGVDPTLRNKLDTLMHPAWMLDVLAHGKPVLQNLLEMLPPGQRDPESAANYCRREVDPDLDWDRIAWFRAKWPRKLILKGLLSVEDAVRARDAGIDGIVLSNHGGRQLDGAISPISVLPEVARRVGADITVLVDSGFRRGTDVVKALALGADAVLVGRALLYGLAAGGEAGVTRSIMLLSEEIHRAMALLGRPAVGLLNATCLKI